MILFSIIISGHSDLVPRVAGLSLAVVMLLSVVIYLLFVSDACLLGIWCNMTGAKEAEDP